MLRFFPVLVFITVLGGAQAVIVHEYKWKVIAVDIKTSGGVIEARFPKPQTVHFLVPEPDYGQVDFGKDVDGDGRPDHVWCGELASLTLYNVAVAKGWWRPTAGNELTPEGLEKREEWFAKVTNIPVEDPQYDAPTASTDPPWFPALISLAADSEHPNAVGVVLYAPLATVSRWFVIVPPAMHAIVIVGASSNGRYFVVKDCSSIQEPGYNWKRDYYLVPAYSLELNISRAIQDYFNPLEQYSSIMPVMFFPIPTDGKLPPGLDDFFAGEKTVEVGGGLKVRFYVFLASTLSDVLEICRCLAGTGVPVMCVVKEPFAWLAYQGQLLEVPLVGTRVLRVLSVPITAVKIAQLTERSVNSNVTKNQSKQPRVSSKVPNAKKGVKTEKSEHGANRVSTSKPTSERRRVPVIPIAPPLPRGMNRGRNSDDQAEG
ncbi:hypothetical protein [Methanopyrus sp.]